MDELRDKIAAEAWDWLIHSSRDGSQVECVELAHRILALPEIAEALAAAKFEVVDRSFLGHKITE